MLNSVRFLSLSLLALVWCGSSMSAADDLNLSDGATEEFWYAGPANWYVGSSFCAANPLLPYCLTASTYPWFAGFGYANAYSGWFGGPALGLGLGCGTGLGCGAPAVGAAVDVGVVAETTVSNVPVAGNVAGNVGPNVGPNVGANLVNNVGNIGNMGNAGFGNGSRHLNNGSMRQPNLQNFRQPTGHQGYQGNEAGFQQNMNYNQR